MISNYQHLDKKTPKKTNQQQLSCDGSWVAEISISHISHVRLAKFQSKASVSGFRDKSAPLQSQRATVASRAALKKKKNTGGDQEETEPGRQQPRTMKPIRPRWEQTPPTFEPVKCKELKRKISWLVAKMAGNSKQLEGEYVSVDACLSLCGPVVNFPRV